MPTFEEAARSVHAEHSAAWRNAKHSAQWVNTLVQYVHPTMGGRRVDQIETPDVFRVLAPIWLTRPETARRVRQRIGAVLDWAKAAGFREGENPVAGVAKGLPRQPDRKAHHAALPYAEVPGFLAALPEVDIGLSPRLAFEFLVLTAARTSEALAARWDELDLDGKTWTIPPERTKTARQHRVPLSKRCLEILAKAGPQSVATEAFDRNLLVPAHADHLRQAVRVVGIGLVDLHRQCRLGVPRIDAHHGQTEFAEAVPVPRAQLPGLEPDAHHVRRPRANGGADGLGRGCHRAAPHDGACLIDDAD